MNRRYSTLFLLILTSSLILLDGCQKDDDDPCKLDDPSLQVSYGTSGTLVFSFTDVEGEDKTHAGVSYWNSNITYKPNDTQNQRIAGDPDGDNTTVAYHAYYPGTTYKAYVQVYGAGVRNCPTESDAITFTTPCAPFRELIVQDVTSTKATVVWYYGARRSLYREDTIDVSPFTLFTLNLRKKGTTEITFSGTDKHFHDLTGLQSHTEYQVQLVYICTDNETYISEWTNFTTL